MKTNLVKTLSDQLKFRGIKRAEIAEKLNYSGSYISTLFLSGKMNTNTYEKILEAAGMTPADLFCKDSENREIKEELAEIKGYLLEIRGKNSQKVSQTKKKKS